MERAIKRAHAAGVDWWAWRIATHPEMKDGLADIVERYTFAMLYEAQVYADFLDEIRPTPEER